MPQQVAQGVDVTLQAFYVDAAGVVADPTNAFVSITDPFGQSIITNGTPTRVTVGQYFYVFHVPPSAPLGAWAARWTGLVAGVPQASEDGFTVMTVSALTVAPPSEVPKVASWFDSDLLISDDRFGELELPDGIGPDDVVQAVSELLFHLSGKRWAGIRTDQVRPHGLVSGCGSSWYTMDAWLNWSVGPTPRMFPEWGLCNCVSSEVLLSGPVTQIVSVGVDDDTSLVEGVDFALYDHRRLVRLDDANGSPRYWPCCQRLSSPLGTIGTWSVTYQHGQLPPAIGVIAAREWALELAQNISVKGPKAPQRTTRLVRGGVDIEIEAGNMMTNGMTGIRAVDYFLEAVNPRRMRRGARVWSPQSEVQSIVTSTRP